MKYSRSAEDEEEGEAKGSDGEVESAKTRVLGGRGGKLAGWKAKRQRNSRKRKVKRAHLVRDLSAHPAQHPTLSRLASHLPPPSTSPLQRVVRPSVERRP